MIRQRYQAFGVIGHDVLSDDRDDVVDIFLEDVVPADWPAEVRVQRYLQGSPQGEPHVVSVAAWVRERSPFWLEDPEVASAIERLESEGGAQVVRLSRVPL